jgi:hypothetical protein
VIKDVLALLNDHAHLEKAELNPPHEASMAMRRTVRRSVLQVGAVAQNVNV